MFKFPSADKFIAVAEGDTLIIGQIYHNSRMTNKYVVCCKEYAGDAKNSASPPFVYLDAIENRRLKGFDPKEQFNSEKLGLAWEDYDYISSACSNLYYTGVSYEEWKMATFEEKIMAEASASVTDELEELLFGKDEPAKAPDPIVCQEGQKMFSDIWGWTPAFGDFPVSVWFHENDDIPELNPFYIWPKDVTEAAVWAIEQGFNPRLVGLPGTGKTDWAVNYAALTGRTLCRINFNSNLLLDDLIGKVDLVKGETKFTYGDAPLYAQRASVMLLDEVSRASANLSMAFLQRFFEKKEIKIQMTGEVIKPHPGLAVVVADNTAGVGDNSDMFPTANIQDVSTLNRFPITLKVDYLAKAQISEHILRMVPQLAARQATKIAEFTALCQTAFAAREISLPFSARQYIPIARMAVAFKDIKKAIQYNFINALDEKDASTVTGFVNSVW